jgi:membrane-associated protease RseP (regulator of RpoE activity)
MLFIACLLGSYAAAMLAHELGHLAAARIARVPASELGLGVGPRLAGFRLAGFRFRLRLLPVASYLMIDGRALHERRLALQLLVHLGGVAINAAAAALAWGTVFGWVNLLMAVGNVLPIYQHDGWKCSVAILRALLGRRSEPAEWAFTFSGGAASLVILFDLLGRIVPHLGR